MVEGGANQKKGKKGIKGKKGKGKESGGGAAKPKSEEIPNPGDDNVWNQVNFKTLDGDEDSDKLSMAFFKKLYDEIYTVLKETPYIKEFPTPEEELTFDKFVEFVNVFSFMKKRNPNDTDQMEKRKAFEKLGIQTDLDKVCSVWGQKYLNFVHPPMDITGGLIDALSKLWIKPTKSRIPCEFLAFPLLIEQHVTISHKSDPNHQTSVSDFTGKLVKYWISPETIEWTHNDDAMGYRLVVYTLDEGKTFHLGHVSNIGCINPGENHKHQSENFNFKYEEGVFSINGKKIEIEKI